MTIFPNVRNLGICLWILGVLLLPGTGKNSLLAMGNKPFWEEDAAVDQDEWGIYDLKGEKRRDKARSALNDAVVQGQGEVVKMLIEKGADINARETSGWTALHWAIHYKQADIARYLIEHGADLNALTTDGYGWTPLTMSIRQKMDETTKLLIAKGADVNMRTDGGKTAISMALKARQPDMAKQMIKRNIFLAGCPRSKEYPVVIGWKGDATNFPENTLPALESAIKKGAVMICIDVQLTKDDELVVIRDADLKRTTGESGLVREKKLREIKELDAGSWMKSEFKGTRIPTLEEVFDSIGKQAMIMIEIRRETLSDVPLLEKKLLDLIQKKKLENSVILISDDYQILRDLRNQSKSIHLAVLGKGGETNVEIPRMVEGINAFVYCPDAAQVTSELVEKLHLAGIMLFPRSQVDDTPRETMEKLKKLEIDGYFTHDPALLKSVFHPDAKSEVKEEKKQPDK